MKQIELVYNGMVKGATIKVDGKEVKGASMPISVADNSEYINLTSVKNAFNQINSHNEKLTKKPSDASCLTCKHYNKTLKFSGECINSPIRHFNNAPNNYAIIVTDKHLCDNWEVVPPTCVFCQSDILEGDYKKNILGQKFCSDCFEELRQQSMVNVIISLAIPNIVVNCYHCLKEIESIEDFNLKLEINWYRVIICNSWPPF